ncbi:hypothetical protein CB0940_04792 [Cercospora beticola]|uniref:Uncharacterized protein n=1 Tax=Cercospora beticola TaxID=122368 RepID=A0A2G5HKN3_CERBT|nr:hypothetical protein CB0940_04792 [Cercospora beticola]PIA93127.1 hypothetical protein CB0940_04792 [Cercospora beticola]WPB02063.1 hypothetical protein RHO25_006697 [Cercospora beticola]CAK1363086.1 unnamed protein product [Cercospora beticola]
MVTPPASRHELTKFMADLPRDFSLVHQQHDWNIHRPRQLFRVPGLIERETKRKVVEYEAAKAEMKAAGARDVEAHLPLILSSEDAQLKPAVARAPAHRVAVPLLPSHGRVKDAEKSPDADAPLPCQSANAKTIPPHVRHAERSMVPGIQPPSAKPL